MDKGQDMKKIMTAGAALLMTTTMATAGGIDRSGQGIGIIFEEGDYAELSFGVVTPSVSGTVAGGMFSSGTITPTYTQLGFGYKTQINDQMSMALIFDQPYGANVDYPADAAPYPLAGSNAEVKSVGLTALGRYEFNPNWSVHAGVRYLSSHGEVTLTAPAPYASTYSSGSGIGYVIGGAYERDDIAMRIALTYSSGIDLELDGSVGGNTLKANLPESVNLDFQTGIAADTLLFGSVRYVAWDGFAMDDSNLPTPLVEYTNDSYTYNIGVGRRINDQLAASFSIGYEAPTGDPTGQLGPTDGFISYQIGASYTMDNGIEVSGGVRYVDVGDATSDAPVNGDFSGNSAIGVGLKIGMSF